MSADTLDLRQIRADRAALVTTLESAGAVFRLNTCRCIFHDDSNASGGVYEKDGTWRYKCLGCGVGGDIIDIRARLNNRTIAEELRHLRPNGNANGNGNRHAAKNGKPKKTHATFEAAVHAAEWASDQRDERGGYKFFKSWSYERVVDGVAVEVARIIRLQSPNDKAIWPATPVAGGWQLTDPPGKWPLLYEPELADGGLIIVNEGEGKADICRSLGFTATCSSHGSGSADETDWQILAGQDVPIILDNDAAGEKYGASVATILTGLTPAARVRLIRLPGLPEGGDVKEWVAAGGTTEQLQQIIDAARCWTPSDALPSKSAKKVIAANDAVADYVLVPGRHATDRGEMIERGADDFTDEVLEKLPSGTMYRRGDLSGQVIGEPGNRMFAELQTDAARIAFDSRIRLGKWSVRGSGENESRSLIFVPCSRDCAGLILARAGNDPRVPAITTFTSYPTYLPGFKLCRPGYQDGVFYDESIELRGLSPITDLNTIRATMTDLLVDFPFKAESDRQNYIGLLVTVYVRSAIEGNAPGSLMHSPLERTGKTKLAEMVGYIGTRKRTPAMQLSDKNEEMDKRILAMLIRGENLLHLDNLKEWVDLPCLASLLTASVYQGRKLGTSEIVDVPNNVTIIATGNNVRASGELVKRMIPVQLQPHNDAPELRDDFIHPDLWRYVGTQRRHILACLLGMVELWIKAGKPRGQKPMGGFDEWAAIVGGIMDVAGYQDWMNNAKAWRDVADTKRGDLRALVQEWHRVHGTAHLKVNEVLEIAERLELFPDVFTGKEGKALQTSFGMRVLARNVDTPVGEWVIKRSTLTRPAVYYLLTIKSEATP